MLASVTLTSEAFRSGHDIRLSSRHHGLESRSGSRSTSCSSSNSNPSRNVKGKSKLKHTQSLTSLKTDQKKAKKKQKPGRSKIIYTKVPSSRTLSSTGLMTNLPLESPFVSRASSPIEIADEDAVAVTQHRSRLMGPPPFPDARKRTSSSHGLRTALSDTFYNPNLPSNAGKSQSADTLPQKVDLTKVDALRSKIKTTFSSRAENRMPRQGNALVMNDRQRRPSAPSWLHPPRPKKRFSERPFMQGEKNTTGNVPLEKQKLRLSSGLNIVLGSKTRPPQEPADTDVPRNAQKQKAPQDPDDAVEWMHSRRDVNFDRPRSRMSIGGSGFGYEFGFEYGEVEGSDVFLSSEEGEDEDEEEEDVHETMETQRKPLGQRIQEDNARRQRISPLDLDATGIDQNFDTLFGKDAVIESTPQKLTFDHQDLNLKAKGLNGYETDVNAVDRKRLTTLTRTHSLPNVSTTVTLSLLSSSSSPVAQPGISKPNIVQKSTNIKDKSEDQDGEVDMELTGDAVTTAIKVSQAGRKGDAGEKTLDQLDADLTPWVTDSIISPPTLYFAMKTKKKGDAQVGLDEKAGRGNAVVQEQRKIGERESRGLHILQPMKPSSPFRLSSPFRPSETSTDTTDHSSFNLIPDREELHERERTLAVAQDNDELHLANAKRTRSGTIVPAGAPTGARRTRSGTIVGPLPPAPAPARPLPAVPSASGSANGKVGAEPKTGLVLPKRTRSGTIIASSAGSGPGLGSLNGGRTRTRSGSVLSVNANGVHTINVMTDGHSMNDQTGEVGNNVDFQNPLDEIQAEDPVSDVECYVDSVYLPPLTSSPDPIDFLRFASIVEEDEEPENMAWFVADDPPSPVVSRIKRLAVVSSEAAGLVRSGTSSVVEAVTLKGRVRRKPGFLVVMGRKNGLKVKDTMSLKMRTSVTMNCCFYLVRRKFKVFGFELLMVGNKSSNLRDLFCSEFHADVFDF
ncbi:hypothetical protein CPB84DRAFT_774918 [Gymnopilus junonius]|uniref:Uncharacterized protein n=1 Tax=Gymnopilus junonius TaxID=109634 RepID=A0A9P5NTW4_GYMJU|nr:hypothetical protein CPB84DRAFT_774918 [Gymnopilus junonius]